MGRYEQSKPFSSLLWLRMIQAAFTVSSAATGLRICLTHTLCLKNVLDCASCHKPHYVSAKCEVSRGAGSVPGWCCVFGCGCRCWKYLVWIVPLRIQTHSAINYYMLMQWLCAEECWEALMELGDSVCVCVWIYCVNATKVGIFVKYGISIFWCILSVLKTPQSTVKLHFGFISFLRATMTIFSQLFPNLWHTFYGPESHKVFVDYKEMLRYFKIIIFCSCISLCN